MTYFQDFLALLGAALTIFAASERAMLIGVCIGGFILASLCWWVCSIYSRLWNKSFRVASLHHFFCALAALLTLVATVCFVALRHANEAAEVSVRIWEEQLKWDRVWASKTFNAAYDKVRTLGIEDFTNYPAPPVGNSIPATHERSQFECAKTYARSAAAHFATNRPCLSSIIQARSEVPADVLKKDIADYFATQGKTYPATKGISLVAAEVKAGLRVHLPRVVKVFRTILVGIFLAGQLLAFGLVGWAAYRDLKAHT
jgi:hypothetical protein